MFERRLKIFLLVVVLGGLALFVRAFTLQVLGRDNWTKAVERIGKRAPEMLETSRGRILDVRGQVMAVDTACTDAAVDYRAIIDPPDPKWVADTATKRLKARYGAEFARGSRTFTLAQRKAMIAEASKQLVADVATMWADLARYYHPADADAAALAAVDPRAALDDVRREIIRQVELRRRLLWTLRYRRTEEKSAQGGRMMRWLGLTGNSSGDGTEDGVPDDSFGLTTGEQQASHVVVHALDAEAQAYFGKRLEQYPALTLKPSAHRFYPKRDVACHLMGQTAGPTTRQIKETEGEDPTRRYDPNETNVGREGVEALCEPLLRGVRGRIDRRSSDDAILSKTDYIPGRDVRLSIDADLQDDLQKALKHVVEHGKVGSNLNALITPAEGVSMHGAIVVIDVKTNEVRALASNPTFDVNDLETRFSSLNADVIESPLKNRATSDAVEPGSTVKPLLGVAAVTQGVVGPLEGIECTGNMYLPVIGPDGRPTLRRYRMEGGRCWVASEYHVELANAHLGVDHHHAPSNAQHKGHDGNADGWLTLSDALERSCDIYFETVADRMGVNNLCHWYDQWGIGRTTGIGIHEVRGLREDQTFGKEVAVDEKSLRRTNCLSGMGQDKILATPLQIANAAAALARGGTWMRPRLLTAASQAELDQARPRTDRDTPDEIPLHLNPVALDQARIGMRNVVLDYYPGTEQPTAGTGKLPKKARPAWLTVAAKTGTADSSLFTYLAKGPDGRLVHTLLKPHKRGDPEDATPTPWYRSETGKGVVHAWYMGYAPVEDPQVAFAVLIEYAGIGGGGAAAPVASEVLDACIAHQYLHAPGAVPATTAPASMPATSP